MSHPLGQRILESLERRQPPVALVSELAAAMRPMPGQLAIESALQDLVKDGRVLVASHPAPDVHLESADLRVVAPVAGDEQAAGVAAESYWNDWLRAFLATHRCQ